MIDPDILHHGMVIRCSNGQQWDELLDAIRQRNPDDFHIIYLPFDENSNCLRIIDIGYMSWMKGDGECYTSKGYEVIDFYDLESVDTEVNQIDLDALWCE